MTTSNCQTFKAMTSERVNVLGVAQDIATNTTCLYNKCYLSLQQMLPVFMKGTSERVIVLGVAQDITTNTTCLHERYTLFIQAE